MKTFDYRAFFIAKTTPQRSDGEKFKEAYFDIANKMGFELKEFRMETIDIDPNNGNHPLEFTPSGYVKEPNIVTIRKTYYKFRIENITDKQLEDFNNSINEI